MAQKILQWGLLSTANINRALIPPLRVSPRNRLLAVGSRSQAVAQAYAQEHGIPRAYGSYEALLADPEIDVIYNPLPNHLHKEWTIRAVQAGKHVLCEKPLALSTAEVDEMYAAARQHGRVVAEAFMYRHHPQTLKVQELVAGGALGKLQLIRGVFTFRIKSESNIRLNAQMGGGSLWDVGCYPVSYARALIGQEPQQVFGWQVSGASGVDESFFGQLEFPGGVYAQFDSGFRSPHRTQIEIVGTEATLWVPAPFHPEPGASLTLQREGVHEQIATPSAEVYLGEVEDMADCILEGRAARISLADSRANVRALSALLASARSGQPVRLD